MLLTAGLIFNADDFLALYHQAGDMGAVMMRRFSRPNRVNIGFLGGMPHAIFWVTCIIKAMLIMAIVIRIMRIAQIQPI